MEKQTILDQVTLGIRQKLVTREEVMRACELELGGSVSKSHYNVSKLLYYIGGVIVFVGIMVLMWQNWERFNEATQILITLGSSIAAYVVAVLFQGKRQSNLDSAFFFISFILLPVGLMTTFYNAGLEVGRAYAQSMVSLLALATAASSLYVFKRPLFALFSTIFGTWFFVAITELLSPQSLLGSDAFQAYRILVIGVSYCLLGYYYSGRKESSYRHSASWLYSVGNILSLGSTMWLGGWSPDQNVFWEAIYPGIVFGGLFLSVYLRSKPFLIFGSLFLVGYIGKITSEYFADNLGWPFMLVLSGLMLIAVGYGAFHINKKYLA